MASKPKPTVNVFFDGDQLRTWFKQLAADARTSMSRRVVAWIKLDVDYWRKTGVPLDLTKIQLPEVASNSTAENRKYGSFSELITDQLECLIVDENLSRERLLALKAGEKPELMDLVRLAKALGWSSEELLGLYQKSFPPLTKSINNGG